MYIFKIHFEKKKHTVTYSVFETLLYVNIFHYQDVNHSLKEQEKHSFSISKERFSNYR